LVNSNREKNEQQKVLDEQKEKRGEQIKEKRSDQTRIVEDKKVIQDNIQKNKLSKFLLCKHLLGQN
jgi:hypothetical protein